MVNSSIKTYFPIAGHNKQVFPCKGSFGRILDSFTVS